MSAPMKRRGLGRGLDALLGEPATDAPASTGLRQLRLFELHPSRVQPRARFEEAELEALADSIRAQGVVQPLIVTPDPSGGFTIVAGERRWRAAGRAGLETVPALVREVADDRQLLEIALVENLQRSDLNPIEEAEAYQALQRDFGFSQEEIAGRVGKGRPTIANSLRMLKLPDEILGFVRAGSLSAGQARPLLALGSEQQQLRLARRAVAEGLTARQMERAVGAVGGGDGKPRRRKKAEIEPNTAAAAERLTRKLQAPVEIRRRGAGGEIRIRFHNEEELIRLFERFSA
jgi:ParB family transcriptional regulator, chromosome partitioning protein